MSDKGHTLQVRCTPKPIKPLRSESDQIAVSPRDVAPGHKQTWSVIAPVHVQADCYDVIPCKEQSGVASCNAAFANAWA